MSLTMTVMDPALGAAGLAGAPAALADDQCTSAVSRSRCLGPEGVDGGTPPEVIPGTGARNGPNGSWGNTPPLG